MGTFEVNASAREHIILRIVQRFLGGDGRETDLRGRAKKLLDRALTALRQQTPDDWRFTRHTSAHFFISVVQDVAAPRGGDTHPEQVKLLGGTYRDSEHGRRLQEELSEYAEAMCGRKRGGVAADSPAASEGMAALERMVELYLADLESADSAVVHELKTSYWGGADIAQRKRSAEQAWSEYPHTLILRGIKMASAQAGMPNALLCDDEGAPGGLALWVRQGDRWSSIKRGSEQSRLYAMFCPLTPDGPTLDRGRIWSFTRNGKLRDEGEAEVNAVMGGSWAKPEGYRSETYWWLPTRMDFLAIDYDYLARECAHLMGAREAAMRQTIQMVYDLAMARLKLQPPPAWYAK